MVKWFCLVIGGSLGTLARYTLSGLTYRLLGTQFPYGTMAVNLAGCFFIGFLISLAETKFVLSSNSRLLLLVGFCGAFTTFSTYILESANLIRDGQTLQALLNLIGSVIIGFICFRIGLFVGDAM